MQQHLIKSQLYVLGILGLTSCFSGSLTPSSAESGMITPEYAAPQPTPLPTPPLVGSLPISVESSLASTLPPQLPARAVPSCSYAPLPANAIQSSAANPSPSSSWLPALFSYSKSTQFCLLNATLKSWQVTAVGSVIANQWDSGNNPQATPNALLGLVIPASFACCTHLEINTATSDHTFDVLLSSTTLKLAFSANQKDVYSDIYLPGQINHGVQQYSYGQMAGNFYNTYLIADQTAAASSNGALSTWMKNIPDNYPLKQIQLIGSHDAGLNYSDGATAFGIVLPGGLATVVAQQVSLIDQLVLGSRYFDLRLDVINDQLVPIHSSNNCYSTGIGGYSNQPFDSSLAAIIQFSRTHPSETIVLKFSHGCSSAPVIALQSLLEQYQGQNLFVTGNQDNFTSSWTLGQVRGRIILLMDDYYTALSDPSKGYFTFKNIFDDYADLDDPINVMVDQLSKLSNSSSECGGVLGYSGLCNGPNNLFLFSQTATNQVGSVKTSLRSRSAELDALLAGEAATFGRTTVAKSTSNLPNIIYYDFIDASFNRLLINNYLLNQGLLNM